MALARRSDGDMGPAGREATAAAGGSLAERFPDLWEFIASLRWPDGSGRVPGTVLLLVEDGVCKCWLNDKAQGLSCWVSGSTFDQTLAAAERAVQGSGADWRRQGGRSGRKS